MLPINEIQFKLLSRQRMLCLTTVNPRSKKILSKKKLNQVYRSQQLLFALVQHQMLVYNSANSKDQKIDIQSPETEASEGNSPPIMKTCESTTSVISNPSELFVSFSEKRERSVMFLQVVSRDQYLTRQTFTLACKIMDMYYSANGASQNVSNKQILLAVLLACLSLATKFHQVCKLPFDRLSKIGGVPPQLILQKEIQVAQKLQFNLNQWTYAQAMDEYLYNWDRSPLNINQENFMTDNEESYQRFRMVYFLMDEINSQRRIESVNEDIAICMLKVLGDTPELRQYLGYSGQIIQKLPKTQYSRHENCPKNTTYVEYLGLQTSLL